MWTSENSQQKNCTFHQLERGTQLLRSFTYALEIYILKLEASVCVCHGSQRALTFIPSNRLRCCDRYIRCQRSLAVKPLIVDRRRTVSRYQFTVRIKLFATVATYSSWFSSSHSVSVQSASCDLPCSASPKSGGAHAQWCRRQCSAVSTKHNSDVTDGRTDGHVHVVTAHSALFMCVVRWAPCAHAKLLRVRA